MNILNAGSVTLLNANTYTGVTTIASGGTLTLGNGSPGSDGSIANTFNVADNGALVFKLAGSQTAAYPTSGTGSLIKTGSAS